MAPGESYKNAMDRAPKPAEDGERFDDILTRLRALVERLEGGNLSLEDSLQSFEQGMELCRRGAAILDAAEKKVEVLLAGPPGANRTAPLPGAQSGSQGGNQSGDDERQGD
jgi:exodeoxyribonuclease VII small subunit